MNSRSAKLIYFSPTQTTKKVLEAILQGTGIAKAVHMDLTPPGAASRKPAELEGELAIIGCPVYTGRVPLDMIARLRQIKGRNTPAVIVVVYGNRAYEDALRELRDVAVEAGFRPLAAAAFIGEHSFSSTVTPVAMGRPDPEDLRKASEFGRSAREKMKQFGSSTVIVPIQVPGNLPYKERGALANIAPMTDEALCTKCGKCASACPTAAIRIEQTVITDAGTCIRCCACVKICSDEARSMQDSRIREVAERLSKNCSDRKEPEIYL
jgi:ferredoxin